MIQQLAKECSVEEIARDGSLLKTQKIRGQGTIATTLAMVFKLAERD